MGRGQEQPGLRHRRLPTPADEEEHVPRDAADGVGSTEGRRQQQLVASPSVRRKLRERQERLEARGRAPSVGTTTKRRKGLWACLWVGLVGLVLPALAVLATAWRKYRSPHPIGFGAAWVSLMTGFFPLIEHDEEHRLDLDALHVSRKRLESSNMLNIAPAIEGTEDILVPSTKANHSVPIRLFRPHRTDGGQGLRRAIVWIHGGGWTVGSVNSDDKIARRLAAASGAVVASVEYRLAPEHKYPAQLEDTLDALEWLLANGEAHGLDTRRVAVAGESAGGHLTIVTAMALGPAAKARLCGIIPVVPATDYGCDSESCHRFREGYLLTQGMVKAFWHSKLSDPHTEQHHHYVSPLRAPAEALGALPPMLLMTAGLDPLRDEGEAFAARAQEAGVEVELVRYERTIHGFFGRVVTNGNCGVQHAARWFDRVCGVEGAVEEAVEEAEVEAA